MHLTLVSTIGELPAPAAAFVARFSRSEHTELEEAVTHNTSSLCDVTVFFSVFFLSFVVIIMIFLFFII